MLFTGDMLSGFAFPAHDLAGRLRRSLDASLTTGSWWEEQWRALTEPLREAGVPWAASLGNHDAEVRGGGAYVGGCLVQRSLHQRCFRCWACKGPG